GNAPWVLTVGASSHQGTRHRGDDTIGDFSSRGPTWIDFSAKPDLVAPGVGIESLADPQGSLYWSLSEYLLDGTRLLRFKPYLSLSGTSMAAPVVSGTVALMLEANPELTPNAVKAILQYTAQVQPDVHPLAQGAGLLNVHGAIRLARFFANPQDGIGDTSDAIEGESIPWAQHLVWGNYRVAGGVPLPGSNAWTLGLTWGALETLTGTPVVWGAQSDDNVVWTTDGDDNVVWTTDGDDNVVWTTEGADNVVWTTDDDDNVVWTTQGEDNVVWTTAVVQNVVWGNDCGGRNCRGTMWGSRRDGAVMGTASADDNVVWTTDGDDNVVWTTDDNGNVVWTTDDNGNVVWTTGGGDNVVWTTDGDDTSSGQQATLTRFFGRRRANRLGGLGQAGTEGAKYESAHHNHLVGVDA
ncbi:MAG: S8 family serine peptidase, partial [Vicinamibacterales bacterium]